MSDMPRLQELHDEIKAMKKETKELKQMVKDELTHVERHKEILEELKTLKAEKKAIETEVEANAPADMERIDELKIDVKSSEELLSDLAFNMLMKEESLEISDEYDNKYEPLIVVKFKKST